MAHKVTSPCDMSPEEFARRDRGRRDLFHELFTRSVLRNKSQGLVPKINWFELKGLGLDCEAKMARSLDGTCPRHLLQVLVAGSSALVCPGLTSTLSIGRMEYNSSIQHFPENVDP